MPHLHMPLQSGSDRILQAMRRSYRVDRYKGIIDKVRSAMPHATITTDIIVGFPGESEADFLETMKITSDLRFLAAYTFQYSKRPGTPAAEMPDQIPSEVVSERYTRLHEHLNALSQSVNDDVVGRTAEVLVTDIDGARASGKSRDFRLVHLDSVDGLRPGDIAEIRIGSAKPHFVRGVGAPISTRKTRGGDAFEARKKEGESTGVMLGIPTLKSIPGK
jgi:tRNA-2-methylthio-N6-dimethylallyladenosine synthase